MLKLTGYWDQKYPSKFHDVKIGKEFRAAFAWKNVHEKEIKLPKRTTPKWFDDLPE